MATDNEPVATYAMSDLARAIETNSPESIDSLNKSETVFYLCHVLEVEPPEAHPSEHNGTVPRSLSQQFARVLGDYVDRTGGDAFNPNVATDDGDDGDDGDESDDGGDSE